MFVPTGLPDYWIELLKHSKDEDWRMSGLVTRLCNRCLLEGQAGGPGAAASRRCCRRGCLARLVT